MVRDFLADDAVEGLALLAVGRAERRAELAQVLDEAEVVDIFRLAVEPALAEFVADLAVEQREVAEHAGVGQADEGEVGRKVELDAPDLAVADVARLEDEGALAVSIAFLAGVERARSGRSILR